MPVVNLSMVNYSKFVNKTHQSVVLESDYVRIVLLPAMGRVYSIFHKPTQHHVLWKNDIAWQVHPNTHTVQSTRTYAPHILDGMMSSSLV